MMRDVFRRTAFGLGFAMFCAGAACADPPQPMLWKASKGSGTLYLLGSMHFLKDSDYPLSPDVDAAYKGATKLVFEIAPDELNSPAAQANMLKRGMYQDPTHKLQDDLSPSTWSALEAYGAKNGLPAMALQRFEPWTAALTLVALETQKLGMDPASGLDQHFMKLASTDHKPSAGLETVDQQLAIFDEAPLKMQEDMLRQALDELPDFPKEMSNEHDLWRHGDVAGMFAEMKKDFAKYPDLYQKLLAQRNRNWIPQIEKMLAENGKVTLVIVGAAHMPGPDGVVQLLQKDGYRVERICTGCASIRGTTNTARKH